MPRITDINLRKGTSTEWSTANPILNDGEPGYDRTTNTLKIGNGISAWNSLSAIGGSGGIDANHTGLAKAWVNFNGVGTVAIRSSRNVSSITDLGVGLYRVNMVAGTVSDANYSVVVSTTISNPPAEAGVRFVSEYVRTTTTFNLASYVEVQGAVILFDTNNISAVLYR